jgi:hypothetical protein
MSNEYRSYGVKVYEWNVALNGYAELDQVELLRYRLKGTRA